MEGKAVNSDFLIISKNFKEPVAQDSGPRIYSVRGPGMYLFSLGRHYGYVQSQRTSRHRGPGNLC